MFPVLIPDCKGLSDSLQVGLVGRVVKVIDAVAQIVSNSVDLEIGSLLPLPTILRAFSLMQGIVGTFCIISVEKDRYIGVEKVMRGTSSVNTKLTISRYSGGLRCSST